MKNYRSIFPEPRNRDEKHGFAATLLELLGQPETGFHAISLLQFMSAELHGMFSGDWCHPIHSDNHVRCHHLI